MPNSFRDAGPAAVGADSVLKRSDGDARYVQPARTVTGTGALTGGGDLSANRTLNVANDGITGAMIADSAIPYDIFYMAAGKDTVRAAASYLDNPFGLKLHTAILITEVIYRVATADASGNLVVEIRKNGTQQATSVQTLAAANQVAGTEITGLSIAFAAGDILTVYVTGVGTTPGKGLVADIRAFATGL